MTKELELFKELGLPLDAVTQKFDIIGQSGGGKTYLAMRLAETMLAAHAQIVVLDSAGVWWGLRAGADGKRGGYSALVFGGEHGDVPINAASGALIADLLVDRGLSAVLDVSELDETDLARFVTDFVRHFFHRKKRNKSPVHVFFEECQEFFPETPTNKGEVAMRAKCVQMMKIGRNFGIGWSAITQEPQAASKRALNQAGTIIAVRTIGEHERKSIAGWARSRAKTKEQLDLMNVLPELETGQALLWSPAWLKRAEVVHVTPKVTFDSSRTPEVGERPRQPVLAGVELEKVKGDLASLVASAERDDPTVLHRRIAELEREAKAKPAAAPPPKPSAPKGPSPVEVQMAKTLAETLTRAEKLSEKTAKLAGQVTEAAGVLGSAVSDLGEVARTIDQAAHTLKRQSAPALPPKPALVSKDWRQLLPVARQTPRAADSEAKLGRCERALLAALGLRHPRPLSRDQVSILSGYSSTSSSFANGLGALRSAGLIDGGGDALRLTAAGEAEAAESIGAAPQGPDETRQMWRGKLGKAELALFDALCDAFPGGMTKEELSQRSGYSATSSSFANALGRLRTLALAVNGVGGVSASEALFSEAA